MQRFQHKFSEKILEILVTFLRFQLGSKDAKILIKINVPRDNRYTKKNLEIQIG